ncbi:MAG: DUF2283 domain-containing protein [Phaeovulum sp.]|jgi:uncharacterized protein YuzE|uniref:DUF2283 domain-containing protein n=1 Tax=Phaeovulum sp. TaxID=2934796 RepID=UPI0027354D23|nr:DUF2283 domain-containing protein [Phaeovulum sp.]MDP2300933.1 DUF2283 domain-containing protein [Ignavibacteria bacterium]MDP3861545.1 DUF2283 domain-containing protein [Phaeovulum sp.]
MAKKQIKVWYDKDSDFLEVSFEKKKGVFKETSNDAVMEKVDEAGHIIGFSILNVTAYNFNKPLSVTLTDKVA